MTVTKDDTNEFEVLPQIPVNGLPIAADATLPLGVVTLHRNDHVR